VRRWVITLLVSGAAVLLVAAVLGLPAGARRAESLRTSINLYSPFTIGGQIAAGVHIKQIVHGSCWTTSIADYRADAYRCFVGNEIHDPCFANAANAVFVLCPLYMPTSPVLRIDLTKRLPATTANGDPTRYSPWALQLINARWCEILSGATGLIAGMRINYGCVGGGTLLGNPRRGAATWTIFYTAGSTGHNFQAVPIRAAWW
jgi:hypothetical protein